MANTVNYNQEILNHVANIDDNRLAILTKNVAEFLKSNELNNKSKNKLDEEYKKLKIESIKAQTKGNDSLNVINNSISDFSKSTKEKIDHQIKLQSIANDKSVGLIEESLDAQKKLIAVSKEASDKAVDYNKEMNRVFNSIAESEKTSNKLQRQAQKLQERERVFQNILNEKNSKFFEFQSNYYNDAREKLKSMNKVLKDFKDNPKGFILEQMGIVMGKAFDKSIDGVKAVLGAMKDAVVDGLKDLSNSIFDMMADQKRQAENISKELNRDYLESSGTLSRANTAAATLAARGELNLSRTTEHITSIATKLLRDYGNELKDLNNDEYNKLFKLYAQAENAGIGNKIDELRTIFGDDTERFTKAIEAEIQLAGIRSRQDIRIQHSMESAAFSLEEAHKLGLSYEEAIEANNKSQIFYAKIMASNKNLGIEEAEAFVQLQKTLMSRDFVTNILENQNVDLSQLIGIDANEAKRRLSGTDEERLDVMNRVIRSGMYNTVPALKELMENLGFNAQSLNVLQKSGNLTIDENATKKIANSMSENWVDFNAQLLSNGSLIQEEIRNRISLLSSEGLRDENGNFTDDGNLVKEQLRELSTFEILKRERNVKDEEDLENYRRIYKLLNEAGGDLNKLKESGELKTLSDEAIAETMKEYYDRSEKLVRDQVQVSKTLSEAQDLGLNKALSGGGLSGLFSTLMDVGMKSAYSPTYQEKLEHFMGNLKKSIEPAVNVFKELLIDPIIDTLRNNIGLVLGHIYDAIMGWWEGDSYTEEESYINSNKFTKSYDIATERKDLASSLLDLQSQGKTNSEDYKKLYTEYSKKFGQNFDEENKEFLNLLKNNDELQKMSFDDISNFAKKNNLSEQQTEALKIKRATESKVLNTGGKILGTDEIHKIVLNPSNRKHINNWLQGYSINFETSDNGNLTAKAPENIYDLVNAINEADSERNGIRKTLDFLSSDKGVGKEELFKTFDSLSKSPANGKILNKNLYNLMGVDKWTAVNHDDVLALLAYELVKGNADLIINNDFIGYTPYLKSHAHDIPNHVAENNDGVYKLYKGGGIQEAKPGGTKAILAEDGYDEIVIPTDPDKKAQAQKLLQIAKDKYNVFLQDPENISDNLSKWFKALVFSVKTLMLQLDPLKDALENNLAQQTFNVLRNIGIQRMKTKTPLQQPGTEANYGSGVYDSSINNLSPVGGMPKQTEEERIQYEAAVKALESWPGGKTKPDEFIKLFGPIAREDMRRSGVPASVTLAQAALETGWGKTAKPDFRNLFGIKGTGPAGSKTVWTHEVYNGVRVQKQSAFRAYNNYLESITDHSSYLRTAKRKSGKGGLRYGEALSFPFAPDKFAEEIHKAGYATSPTYSQKLKGLMRDRNMYVWNLSPDPNAEQAIGVNADGSLIYASDSNMSFDPSLQSIPNASMVSDNVSRINTADVEKEKLKTEQQSKRTESMLNRIVDALKKMNFTPEDTRKLLSLNSVSPSNGFCTTPQYTHNPIGFGEQRR